MPENFTLPFMQMKIYSVLIKIPGNAVFSFNEMSILSIDLNNVNLDNNFHEDGSDTIIYIRHLACHIKFEKSKALKKAVSKELIPIAWHA